MLHRLYRPTDDPDVALPLPSVQAQPRVSTRVCLFALPLGRLVLPDPVHARWRVLSRVCSPSEVEPPVPTKQMFFYVQLGSSTDVLGVEPAPLPKIGKF